LHEPLGVLGFRLRIRRPDAVDAALEREHDGRSGRFSWLERGDMSRARKASALVSSATSPSANRPVAPVPMARAESDALLGAPSTAPAPSSVASHDA
jgi:hypothetical protein